MVFAAFRQLFARRPSKFILRRPRVALELLEDRLVPAAVDWICGDGDWNTPSCWSTGQLPGAADDVTINRPGTVTVRNGLQATTILSLNNSEILELSGTVAAPSVFSVDAASQNHAGATLRLRRGNLSGTGTFANSGILESTGVSRINVGFSNEASGTLRSLASNQFANANNLTFALGFTNSGQIELTSSGGALTSTIRVETGTLTNAAGATITSLSGTGGGRNLAAQVTNLGQITINQNLNVDIAGRTFTTSAGALSVAANRLLAIKAGSVNPGTAIFGSGTTMSGTGTIDLGGTVDLQLSSDFTLPAGSPRLTFTGTVEVNGPGQFINQSTFQMTSGDVFLANVVNEGTFEALGLGNEIQGTFTSGEASTLRVVASRTHRDADLTMNTGFTNNGQVELTDNLSDTGSTLTVLSGAILNATGRTVLSGGIGLGNRTLAASLTNEGTLRLEKSLLVDNDTRTFTCITGQIEFVQNVNLTLQDGNSIFGDGLTVLVGNTSNRVNLAGVHTMSLAATTFILFNTGPQLKLVGRVTINGPGTLINQIPLELTGDIINAPLENQAEVIAWGAGNQINGLYQATSGSGIRIEGRDPCEAEYGVGACGDAELTIGQNFINNGPFRLTSIDAIYSAMLIMPANTTLTNDATITAELGTGGDRILSVELNNRGRVVIGSAQLQLTGIGANHVNAATGEVEATIGSLVITDSATFHNLGTLDIGAAQVVAVTSGTVVNYVDATGTFTGGTFKINDGQFRFPGANIRINLATIELTNSEARILDDADDSNGLGNFHTNGRTANNVGLFQLSNIPNYQILADFTNDGILIVGAGSDFNVLNGNLTNFDSNTLTLGGPGTFDIRGTLRFTGANIVENAATLILSSAQARIQDGMSGDALATFARNSGTLIVQGGHTLTLDTFDNSGLLQINNQGIVEPTVLFNNLNGGTLRLNGGTMNALDGIRLVNASGARIDGSGTIQCTDVENSGVVGPGIGTAAGTLTIKGNYSQSASGTLEIHVRSSADFDTFLVTEAIAGDDLGNVTLAGALTILPVAPYNPTGGTNFQNVVRYRTRSGAFGSVTNGYTPTYTDPPMSPAGVSVRRN